MLHDGFSGNKLYSHYLLKKNHKKENLGCLVIDRKEVLIEFFTNVNPSCFLHLLSTSREKHKSVSESPTGSLVNI